MLTPTPRCGHWTVRTPEPGAANDPSADDAWAADPWAAWQRTRPRRALELPGYRRAAVLVGLSRERDPRVLLTRRSDKLPTHQGQICFPGGSLENGESPAQAALREAWEEVGLAPQTVQVLGELGDVWTPTGFHVTPVLVRLRAELDERIHLCMGEEVSAILLPRLSELRAAEAPPTVHRRQGGEVVPMYRYLWQSCEIWGMTARVLRDLLGSGLI